MCRSAADARVLEAQLATAAGRSIVRIRFAGLSATFGVVAPHAPLSSEASTEANERAFELLQTNKHSGAQP